MTLQKRSINLAGHATSLALEPEFWAVLEAAAAERGVSLPALIGSIDSGRAGRPLASSCRLAVLSHLLTPRSAAASGSLMGGE